MKPPARRALSLALACLLAGCNATQQEPAPLAGTQYPSGAPVTLAPAAGAGGTVGTRAGDAILLNPPSPANRLAGPPQIVTGTGRFVDQSRPVSTGARVALTGSDVTLDFTNVDVRDVLKSVLGDLLKLSYTVDPAVQGTVTLQTGSPIPRSALLDVLNTALGLSGVALVERGGLYLAVPIANAARQAPLDGGSGFVTRIVPLQYVSAADLQPVLEPLVPPGASVRADASRNILIVSGSARDVAAIGANIATFDVDYLRGMSFALLPLNNGRARNVAADVNNLLKSAGKSVADLVRVIPIERMNAVLVTSTQPAYLERVRGWVERLDHGEGGSDQQLFVYRVQNGRAMDIARVLRRALGIDAADVAASAQEAVATAEAGAAGLQAGGAAAAGGLDVLQGSLSGTPPPPASPSGGAASGGAASGGEGSGGTGAVAPVAGAAAQPTSDIRVTADRANNALVITATAQEYAPIEAALQKLDIPPLQVLIDATVAEVTLTDKLNLGLQYYFNSGVFKGIFAPGVGTPTTASTPGQPIFSNFPGIGFLSGFNFGYSSDGTNIILQALAQLTTVRVLSSPNLLVLNNGTARLQVGDQVPIETQSATSNIAPGAQTVNSIAYKDTGVILNIVPRVNASGLVLLDMSEEISQPALTSSSSLNSPTISQRRVTSSVAIHDGETIGLAGLITDNRQNSTFGLPWLKDLPYVGFLFGVKADSILRTELLLLVTPHVIRSREDGDAVTQELREKLRMTVPVFARQR